jgi:hypothetical protein
VDYVQANSYGSSEAQKWFLDDAIVDANKWDYTHVPQEVLFCNHLVEHYKNPCLNQHCEE